MGKKKVTVSGEVFNAGKGLLSEMGRQIFGGKPKKKKPKGGNVIIVNYYFNNKKHGRGGRDG